MPMLRMLIRFQNFHAKIPAVYIRTRSFSVSSSADEQRNILSLDEFEKCFQRCLPPQYKEDKIAVAFSGGPDSTCLLYLLKQLTMSKTTTHQPCNVTAITIDHGLQTASSQMTTKCASIAESLQVRHVILRIPWGIKPFPPVPSKGSSFEKLAREARYHLLLSALKEEGISTIAFGHHADDQVETALLRIGRGSTEAGVAGMKARRLWGMGFGSTSENLGWAGRDGMNRWIIRPLLHFPKKRLVSTCYEAGLDFVVDKTNFQPDIALRNRIRHHLEDASSTDLAEGTKALLDMAMRVASSESGAEWEHGYRQTDGSVSLAQLRSAVESISDFVEKVNYEASIQLAKCVCPSPVSTILLSKDAFSRVTDNSVRLEIIRRVLRFVSPFPWGSPRAEAGRRKDSLQRISDTLTMSGEGSRESRRTPRQNFVAGGGVIWSPVRITRNAVMKFSEKGYSVPNDMAWLASRQPPIQRFRDTVVSPLELDITSSFLLALSQDRSTEILYDCRFLIHITPRLFPLDILDAFKQITAERSGVVKDQASVKLLVIPHTRYFLPKIVLRRMDAQAEILSSGDDHYRSQGQANAREDEHEIARLLPDGSTRTQSSIGENNKSGMYPGCNGEAVRIKCIRILDTDAAKEYLGQKSM
ncbi:hypothetical protein ACEPAG_5529 [Sanghuangporus baumii]